MGTSYRSKIDCVVHPKAKGVDLNHQKSIAHQILEEHFEAGDLLCAPHTVDYGKFNPNDVMEMICDKTTGVVFCVTLVSEYGEAAASYYQADGVGFLYRVDLTQAPPFDLKRAQDAMKSREEEVKRARLRIEKEKEDRKRALNKLTTEERNLLGLK